MNLINEINLNEEGKYFMIEKYCKNHQLWRSFIAEYKGINLKDAKVEITKLFYSGIPSEDIPFLWVLK